VGLAFDVLGKHGGESRLADAGLARDQHHPTIAALRLLTAANKQLDFLLTADKRRLRRIIWRPRSIPLHRADLRSMLICGITQISWANCRGFDP
jgi:hypothetical protein